MMELMDEPEEEELPKKETKKSNTNMKYTRPIKSDVIRFFFVIIIIYSKTKMSLFGNNSSCFVQLF